ncbi:MAG: hypothetical protein ACR2JW_08195 [Thermomicrobiales bacterium]
MPYTQTALALNGAAASAREHIPLTMHPTSRSRWPATLRHTLTPSSGRLPGDLWAEYRCECATRDRLHLPDVSRTEFQDMRDWTDGIEEQEDDDDWITAPDTDAPPYGRIRWWR